MKLIDADALVNYILSFHDRYTGEDFKYDLIEDAFIYELNNAPTVDAVPVIRCRDCKHYRGYAGIVDGYCYMAEWYKRYQYPDDFCSRAERKEE